MKLPKELRKVLTQVDFDPSQYFKQEAQKKQIYLHHTASSKSAVGDIRFWLSNSERIATAFVIDDNRINQLFSSKYWAHHLGVKRDVFEEQGLQPNNTELNKASIGIEITSWGPLKRVKNSFISWAGTPIPKEEVVELEEPYRDFKYYHKYTNQQLEMLAILLAYLGETYNIPLEYDSTIWDIHKGALSGEPGVYSHTSVRPDKSDVFPQPELINLLSCFGIKEKKEEEKEEKETGDNTGTDLGPTGKDGNTGRDGENPDGPDNPDAIKKSSSPSPKGEDKKEN